MSCGAASATTGLCHESGGEFSVADSCGPKALVDTSRCRGNPVASLYHASAWSVLRNDAREFVLALVGEMPDGVGVGEWEPF